MVVGVAQLVMDRTFTELAYQFRHRPSEPGTVRLQRAVIIGQLLLASRGVNGVGEEGGTPACGPAALSSALGRPTGSSGSSTADIAGNGGGAGLAPAPTGSSLRQDPGGKVAAGNTGFPAATWT
ncbi:MAG TPA: hypothetical protein VFR67_25555, partial [Pilimelia sp.]|nr:hypothetical protein [Pilimelia sp.]